MPEIRRRPDVQIEPFNRADRRELAAFAVQAYSDTYNWSPLPARDRQGLENVRAADFVRAARFDDILVAKLGHGIVGYTQFGDAEPDMPADTKELRKLYVASDLLGQGIGGDLMDTALESDTLASARQLYLWVWGGNKQAIGFYKNGYEFRPEAIRPYSLADGTPTYDLMMIRDQIPPR